MRGAHSEVVIVYEWDKSKKRTWQVAGVPDRAVQAAF